MYYAVTGLLGLALTALMCVLVFRDEIGPGGATVMALTWNVFFAMILPLVLDWAERSYFHARFLKLEEVSASNPELAAALSEQCEKLSIEKLRLAVVDSPADEVFGYALWGSNPRLIMSGSILKAQEKAQIVPSIEAELTRLRSQDHTMVFLLFTVFQVVLEQAAMAVHH